MNPYQPESWHDFFLAAAGASAALTGLLFVALSLHIRYIVADDRYRTMARGSLIGLVMVLVLSLVVLIHQPASWTGVQVAVISALYVIVEGGYEVIGVRQRWRTSRTNVVGNVAGQILALVGVVGGLSLVVQAGPGLYAIVFICIVVTVWNLWDAWVLLVGVADEEIAQEAR